MKLMLKKAFFIGLLLVSLVVSGQQESQFTQYMYNTNVINPAYAGNRNVLSINAIHRSQWVGLEGAPITNTVSIHSPVGNKLGVGFNALSDKIGPSTEIYANVDVAYTLDLNANDLKFSFGIKAGFHSLNVDFNKLLIYNPTGEAIQNNINKISPTIGAGGYLFTDNWYVGISTPNLLETNFYTNTAVSRARLDAHYYLIGGYVFNPTPNLKIKPAGLVKMVSGAPTSFDVSLNFLMNEKLTLGTSYRLGSAVSALAGMQISEKIMLGYSYDYDTTELRGYNSGSHEVFIRFDFISNYGGKISPRFF